MSRAAGTLQTTYNATYYPPSFMPGYRGHVPTTQFQYGETFELVMSDRRRSRDQYLYIPKYTLNNINVNRTNEIRKFYQLSQEHRDTYIDRNGTLHPVEYFTLPVPNERMYEANLPFSSMLLRHTSDINIPFKQNFPAIKEIAKQSGFQLFPPSIQTSNNTKGGLEQQQQRSATNSVPIVDQVC